MEERQQEQDNNCKQRSVDDETAAAAACTGDEEDLADDCFLTKTTTAVVGSSRVCSTPSAVTPPSSRSPTTTVTAVSPTPPSPKDEEQRNNKHADSDDATETSSNRSSSSRKNTAVAPGPHDVLLGRGLATYSHKGNVEYRKLVTEHKLQYILSNKMDKPKIAKKIVHLWRQLDPPGRFLTRKTVDEWVEVGDYRAQLKTSQCLRERTPDVLSYYKYMRAQKKSQRADENRQPAQDQQKATGGHVLSSAEIVGIHAASQRQQQQQATSIRNEMDESQSLAHREGGEETMVVVAPSDHLVKNIAIGTGIPTGQKEQLAALRLGRERQLRTKRNEEMVLQQGLHRQQYSPPMMMQLQHFSPQPAAQMTADLRNHRHSSIPPPHPMMYHSAPGASLPRHPQQQHYHHQVIYPGGPVGYAPSQTLIPAAQQVVVIPASMLHQTTSASSPQVVYLSNCMY